MYQSIYIKTHFIHREIEIEGKRKGKFRPLRKLTSSKAPTVFLQAFIIATKFEVVGEETSSLASVRKLLTVILSGMMAGLGRASALRTHLVNNFTTILILRRERSKVSGKLRD